MIKNIPIYEISIDLMNPDTTVSFNSLVLDPAHEISFQTFANVKRFEFNDVEQVISGVAISADTPIYRYDSRTNEEYYVVFTKAAIKDIIFDYARRGNFNNVDLEHSHDQIRDDMFMIHSYQVDAAKGFTAPERFKDVNDGSWIVSYKTPNTELYNRAKNGEWTGFSIEGDFILEHVGNTEEVMMSKIKEEIDSLTSMAFAHKRISFDYDDTLTTAKGQDMARRFLAANDEIFIITARTQSNGGPVYAMAEKLRIKKENVYFTAGKHKWMTVKKLRIEKHIDNNEEELQLITENTEAEAIKI
jgi:hypothetical protein